MATTSYSWMRNNFINIYVCIWWRNWTVRFRTIYIFMFICLDGFGRERISGHFKCFLNINFNGVLWEVMFFTIFLVTTFWITFGYVLFDFFIIYIYNLQYTLANAFFLLISRLYIRFRLVQSINKRKFPLKNSQQFR